MTGGALSTANFNNNADSFLFLKFQPALRGNGLEQTVAQPLGVRRFFRVRRQ